MLLDTSAIKTECSVYLREYPQNSVNLINAGSYVLVRLLDCLIALTCINYGLTDSSSQEQRCSLLVFYSRLALLGGGWVPLGETAANKDLPQWGSKRTAQVKFVPGLLGPPWAFLEPRWTIWRPS